MSENDGMFAANWSLEFVNVFEKVIPIRPKCTTCIKKITTGKEYEHQLTVEFLATKEYKLEIENNKYTMVNIKIEETNMGSVRIKDEKFKTLAEDPDLEYIKIVTDTTSVNTLLTVFKIFRNRKNKTFVKLLYRCNFNDMNEIFTNNFVLR